MCLFQCSLLYKLALSVGSILNIQGAYRLFAFKLQVQVARILQKGRSTLPAWNTQLSSTFCLLFQCHISEKCGAVDHILTQIILLNPISVYPAGISHKGSLCNDNKLCNKFDTYIAHDQWRITMDNLNYIHEFDSMLYSKQICLQDFTEWFDSERLMTRKFIWQIIPCCRPQKSKLGITLFLIKLRNIHIMYLY